ncbi:hypothetical protein GJAV_G00194310 [Gymnothorax javanicus]|nr:hypothetical protein GJAV_G00194310 [Gymnothorax javanicus]
MQQSAAITSYQATTCELSHLWPTMRLYHYRKSLEYTLFVQERHLTTSTVLTLSRLSSPTQPSPEKTAMQNLSAIRGKGEGMKPPADVQTMDVSPHPLPSLQMIVEWRLVLIFVLMIRSRRLSMLTSNRSTANFKQSVTTCVWTSTT